MTTELDPRAVGGRRLEGKACIVTGAGQGIGRGIARRFAREGAKLALAEWKPHRAERVRKELFPRLLEGYDRWRSNGATEELTDLVADARRHWEGAAESMLALLESDPPDLDAALDTLLAEQARF